MKKYLFALSLLLVASPTWAAPDADHDADRSVADVAAITPAATDRWLLLDASNSFLLGYVATSGVRAAIGLATTDVVSFAGVTASGSGGLKAGTENSVRGAITLYSNVNPYAVGINSAATPTGTYTITLPAGAPAGANYLWNMDADGTSDWTNPADFLTPTGVGGSLTVTATGFDGNLDSDDNTVQEIAQALDDLVASGTDDQTASEVPFTPNGSIAATNTQAAIQEVRDEAGSGHTEVTINATANGLSVNASQVLTLGLASTSTIGALSDTDWDTFNDKQAADTDLADLADGSLTGTKLGISDAGNYFTGTNAETVLQELGAKLPTGADGSYGLIITNNTTRDPIAASDELYPEANVWKVNQNGTERSIAIGPLAGQPEFTGPTQTRAYALPDAATTILTTNAAVTPAQGGTGVANGANNTVTFTGNYTLGLTLTGNTAVTFPTSGTLITGTSPQLTTPVIVDGSTLTFDESAADPDDADLALSATDGVFKIAAVNGANNEDLTVNLDSTANTAVVASSTGVTSVGFPAINLTTTGYVQGGVKIVTDADGMSESEMTAGGMYGTLFLATGAGTWTLPTAVEGMSGCLRDTGTNHDLILDVQADDDFRLLGVEDTNGDGVTNAATTTTGDMICFVATSAGHWMSMGIGGVWVAQ